MKSLKQTKEHVLEIVEIAKACPENLQALCFETLLKHYLLATIPESPTKEKKTENIEIKDVKPEDVVATIKSDAKKQSDLKESDLHVKVKRLLEREGVTVEHINNLFYRDGEQILPLFDNLKTTKLAECQCRIVLLQAFVAALASGEFETPIESVRSECQLRKCYDPNNFTNNFRNRKTLFDADEKRKVLKLTEAGKKELSVVIKEMQ